MTTNLLPRHSLLIAAAAVACAIVAPTASATHSWGYYHWGRTSNPFTLDLGDNVSSVWQSALVTAAADWTDSGVLDTVVAPGLTSPKRCKATGGRVEVCNSGYGKNGWLGIATIYVSGTHITQGAVKLNDTYFNTATYNKPAWRALVMCQEIGHTFGLDHQDENFSNGNLGTCMDYTSNPDTNQHPNQHDYDQLETIYSHPDSTNTVGPSLAGTAAAEIDHDDPKSWGKLVKQSKDGLKEIYEADHGRGAKTVTFVFWAEEHRGKKH